MQERDVVALEVTYLREKVSRLRAALRTEQESKGVDLGRWGSFSHDWNKDLRAWRADKADCVIRSSRHRKAHRVAIFLFAAWEEIHYTLTRKTRTGLFRSLTIVKTTTLEEVERLLSEFDGEGEAGNDETSVIPRG